MRQYFVEDGDLMPVSGDNWPVFFDFTVAFCFFDGVPVQFPQVMDGGIQLPFAPAPLQTTHAEAIRALAILHLSEDGFDRCAALTINRLTVERRAIGALS